MNYEIQDIPEGTYAVIKRTVPPPEIPNVIGHYPG